MRDSDKVIEERNRKAQAMLEAALGGEELKADLPITTTGDKLREELLERAKEKQRINTMPAAIRNVSFAYQRSKLGGNFAMKKPEDPDAKAKREKHYKKTSDRLTKLGIKEDLSGKKALVNNKHIKKPSK